MENRIEQLEKENAKLKSALEKSLDTLLRISKESDEGIEHLNEYAKKHYPNLNGMYDVDLHYMMDVGRHAWAYRAKKIVGYSVIPIITEALK